MNSNITVQVTADNDRREDALADAHERFAGYHYADGMGFAFHGPMGVEALSTLGHDDLVAGWAEGYKAWHAPIGAPPPVSRLDPEDEASWRPALGDPSRLSDWADLFGRRLREEPWQAVLQRWLPLLLPGYPGALTHGLLRVAHGVRAMPTRDAPAEVFVDELGRGLAYWAATFKELPAPPPLDGSLALDAAIARLPQPDEPWSPIEAGMFLRLGELSTLPQALAAVAPPRALDDGLSDLTAAFCRVMLVRPPVFPQGLVHAVTPVAAVRVLLPYLGEAAREELYALMWQTSAAIVCGFAPPPGDPGGAGATAGDGDDAPDLDEAIARAVDHRDEHVIKFVEACVRENDRRPDPVYARAAHHVADHMPRW